MVWKSLATFFNINCWICRKMKVFRGKQKMPNFSLFQAFCYTVRWLFFNFPVASWQCIPDRKRKTIWDWLFFCRQHLKLFLSLFCCFFAISASVPWVQTSNMHLENWFQKRSSNVVIFIVLFLGLKLHCCWTQGMKCNKDC